MDDLIVMNTITITAKNCRLRGKESFFNIFLQGLVQCFHSDASTEDESDVGEPQKYGDLNPRDSIHDISDYKRYVQGFLRYTSRRAASRSKLSQEASKVNNQLENITTFYQNPDPKRTKDGHKPKKDLNLDGMNNPKLLRVLVQARRQKQVQLLLVFRETIGDSSVISSTPTY